MSQVSIVLIFLGLWLLASCSVVVNCLEDEATSAIQGLRVHLPQIAYDQGPEGDEGRYVCVCMDWWPETKCDYGHCPWQNSSVLTAPLGNPRFQALIKQFDGITLRVGGTLADSVVYQESEDDPNCLPFEVTDKRRFGFQNGCLTRQRWREFTKFAQKVNAQLIFGINAMYGRSDHNASAPWNPNNARAFLEFLKEEKLSDAIQGFEYGNELFDFENMTAKMQSEGIHQLNDMLKDIFGADKDGRPPFQLLGPDGTSWKRETFFNEFLKLTKDVLYGVTWHSYPLGPSYNTSKPLESQMMRADKMATIGEKPMRHIQQDAPRLKLIQGESGGAYNSGHDDLSNRYIDSFWYLKSMAVLAQNQHQMFCRQTLLGGFYELIDQATLRPNPSYFAALMFSRFMGREVWQTEIVGQNATKGHQRVYAHCHQREGRLGVLILNYSPDVTAILEELDGRLPSDLVPRDEYIVTAHHLRMKTIMLNGRVLKATYKGKFSLDPVTVTDREKHVTVPPYSYAFVVFGKESAISQKKCSGS